MFYRLVSLGLIEKTEQEYQHTVVRLVEMRLSDDLPWEWVTDSTRYARRARYHNSLVELLKASSLASRSAEPSSRARPVRSGQRTSTF